MTIRVLATLASAFIVFANAHAAPPNKCPKDTVGIRVNYGFKDVDARAKWVYESLKPSVATGTDRSALQEMQVEDGVAKMLFCTKLPTGADRFTFRAGPRSHDLAMRPITKEADGTATMPEIPLLNQARPDWVIIESLHKATPDKGGFPVFDVSIVNFGPPHAGGTVKYTSEDTSWRCAVGASAARVEVLISLVGQRLKVISTDPDYPQDQLSRPAQLDTAVVNGCPRNYRLSVEFGPTGRLVTGPNRVRFSLKEASPLSHAEIIRYFDAGQIQVHGDGIW